MNSSDKARPKYRDVKEDNGRSNLVWVTKEKEQIRVVDMGNEHLVNTIRMLERFSLELEEGACDGWSILCCLQGEMAQDAVESELDALDSQIAEVTYWIIEMRTEAEYRGIKDSYIDRR